MKHNTMAVLETRLQKFKTLHSTVLYYRLYVRDNTESGVLHYIAGGYRVEKLLAMQTEWDELIATESKASVLDKLLV